MEAVSALAVDLGSASGRIVAGTYNGERLTVKEIYRFAHEPQLVSGDLVWDLDMIWEETLTGIRKALTEIENPLSISVDTWGVDMVLLDANGQKIGPAYSYRDERTSRTYADLQEVLPDAEAWEDTGTAPATINSSNQLFALLRERPDLARQVAKVLWLPDYFIYKLSGQMGWSRSIVSTSGLCEPST